MTVEKINNSKQLFLKYKFKFPQDPSESMKITHLKSVYEREKKRKILNFSVEVFKITVILNSPSMSCAVEPIPTFNKAPGNSHNCGQEVS